MVMIDGADDLATAFQGSGIPQQLQFALQVPSLLQGYLAYKELPPPLGPYRRTMSRAR